MFKKTEFDRPGISVIFVFDFYPRQFLDFSFIYFWGAEFGGKVGESVGRDKVTPWNLKECEAQKLSIGVAQVILFDKNMCFYNFPVASGLTTTFMQLPRKIGECPGRGVISGIRIGIWGK